VAQLTQVLAALGDHQRAAASWHRRSDEEQKRSSHNGFSSPTGGRVVVRRGEVGEDSETGAAVKANCKPGRESRHASTAAPGRCPWGCSYQPALLSAGHLQHERAAVAAQQPPPPAGAKKQWRSSDRFRI